MRVFVTGGSGIVGRRLITSLRERGNTVLALARSEQAIMVVRGLGAEPVKGDLDSEEVLKKAIAGCDVVFHSAAILNFQIPAEEQEKVNVEGTRNLLKVSQEAGVPRFVYVSAASIILTGKAILEADESWPIPQRSIGVYSRTKAEAEKLILSANAPGFTTVAVRPPLIWGVSDMGTLPQMVEMIKKGNFAWFDQGKYLYVTCHVDNVVEGLLLAAEKGRGGEAYFLTDGTPVIFRDFMTRLLATQNVQPGKRSIPHWMAVSFASFAEWGWKILGRKGKPSLNREMVIMTSGFTVSDTKARQELGYTASVSQEQGIKNLL